MIDDVGCSVVKTHCEYVEPKSMRILRRSPRSVACFKFSLPATAAPITDIFDFNPSLD